MEGEFLVEDKFGLQKGIGGGNFLILAGSADAALAGRRQHPAGRLRDTRPTGATVTTRADRLPAALRDRDPLRGRGR